MSDGELGKLDSDFSKPPSRRSGPPAFISIVLSFFNEERVLRELIRRLRTVLEELSNNGITRGHELIFVNDASNDQSLPILLEEQQAKKDIVIINMSRNFGVSECVLAGMAEAKGDAVIYMDSDLQDPPELIPELVQAWLEDSDVEVVYTTRRKRLGEHRLKLLFTRIGYRFINLIAEISLPVDSGDFKLLSRRAVTELIRFREKRPYVRGLVSWIGFKQVAVVYDRSPRYDGRENTKFPVLSWRVIQGYLDRALISFSDIPLKFALVAGIVVSGLAGLYICVVIIQKIMGWYVPGWPAIMATMLFLGGTQLMILGIFGLYINTIFLESKRRPNFIVKNIIRVDGQINSGVSENTNPPQGIS